MKRLMKKMAILLAFMCMAGAPSIYAQCYEPSIREAKKSFDAKDYAQAKIFFQAAANCPDCNPSDKDSTDYWVARCDYKLTLEEAQKQFKAKNYKKAKEIYQSAADSPFKSDDDQIEYWIGKCDEEINKPEPAPQPVPVEPTDDEKYDKAVANNDIPALVSLADKGYAKAYPKLAVIYFGQSNFPLADQYADKACKAGVGADVAKEVLKGLDLIGYYDNGEHEKPSYLE